jgi:hypothetical protein
VVGDPTFPVSLEALPQVRPPRSRRSTAQPMLPGTGAKAEPQSVGSKAADGPEGTGPGPAESAPKKRKVNTSSKGTAIELSAIKILEAEGYKVHRCVRTGVKRGPFYFSQSNDVFGCIDLVAKKRGTRTRWIQVTAHSGIGQKKKDLDEVPWDPAHDSVEIWRWVGGQNRKHKTTGAFLERQYFQVYHLDQGYELDRDKRIPLVTPPPTPGGAAT